jgi:DnaD/phage-associated family protein
MEKLTKPVLADWERRSTALPQVLLPGEVLAMTGQAVDRLLKLDSGDAALLYLYLLRHGSTQGLRWPEDRLRTALDQLKSQGLAAAETSVPDPPVPEAPPPEYATEDINAALSDRASAFPALCDEVERRLGKKLSVSDLKILYTLFDHLALPAEVILLLVGWCTEEMERKYGPGRKPSLPLIRREGNIWASRGVDTIERAEEHIAKLTRLRSREAEVLRLLDIPPRPLVEREKTYIAAWDDMGFDNDALRMAYEKTVLKKQSMDWGYMNGILRRWHEKGLHTAAAIQVGDRDPRPILAGGRTPPPAPAAEEQQAREDMDRMRRLLEQMKKEG